MKKTPIAKYLVDIESALQKGDSTEHTHRPALKVICTNGHYAVFVYRIYDDL